MKNILRSLFIAMICLMASTVSAADVTFTMSSIFDGTNQSATVTTPTAATVSTNASKSNAKTGKLGSDGHYFEIVLASETYTAASINGFINTNDQSKNWAFQFSTDGGTNWSSEVTQANDGNKTAHDIAVGVTIPANANGFRVVRRAGTSTQVNSITLTLAGPAGPSTDATLSSLVYGTSQTSVPSFSPSVEHYDVELPANYVGSAPSIQGTPTDANASITDVTQATSIPGTASITVTAQDGTTTKTYTVTFSRESAAPKVESATWSNIRGTAVIDQVNLTITGQVLNGSSLTLAPQFTGKNLDNQSPTGAQNFANGPVTYTFTSATSEQTTYSVTITEAPAVSSDATLNALTYGGQSVPNFSAETYVYNIQLASGTTSAPIVAATANESHATVSVTQATSVPGVATVLVTAQDGTTKLTYTVNFTIPVPPSGLSTHEPGLYEADEFEGGYGLALATLTEDNVTREYEVYYLSNNNGDFISAGNPQYDIDKSQAPGHKLASGNGGSVDAGWVKTIGSGNFTSKAALNMGEFQAANSNYMSINDAHYIELHIKGFDQFSMIANDKSTVQPDKTGQDKKAGEHLKIFIDDTPLERGASDMKTEDPSLFRFPISTGEHVIKIAGTGSTNNRFRAFSLRVAQEPRTKYVDGNDSTQEVLQTTAPQAVYYYTKYNSLGETRLEWDGAQGTGFTLETVGSSKVGDTLALGGTAQCPVGEYHYFVKTYFNGVETSSVPGKIKVTSLIKPKGATRCEAYQNEAIDDIRFTYYALSGDDITLTWENNKIPAGISGHGDNGIYIISGTPTQVDTFVYTISVLGGNSISDTLFVDKLDLGNDPILYLYKNDGAKAKDGTYKYLTSAGGGNKNLVARKAKADGKRSADQYSKYKWILISEDVDANNEEVLAIARGEVDLPVLNMKSFTYAPGRLNWGEPDNGSLTDRGRFITVYRDDHPIFQALNKHKGDSIMVLDPVEGKGLMPIDVNYGGVCLATALTRDIDDYYGDGPERTIMHEVERSNGKKYICFPIGMEGSNHLTADGKRLLNQTIIYLLSNDATIKAPSLAITQFRVGSYDGVIDDENSVITLNVKEEDSELMKAAKPVITLASPMTFVTPNSGEAVNFIEAPYGIRYTVSDYVTKRNYNVIVRLYNPQGIDNIEVGTWLNIFDVYGRKVATTNQDIRTMDLPHGMYIVVTESGQTIKIMR